MVNKIFLGVISLIAALTLAACQEEANEVKDQNNSGMHEMDHSNMNHSSSGEVPEDLKGAENPTYPKGSKAIIQADHMEGMKGSEATIVGAYDTTVYSVSYKPTNGEELVSNHKWVIHEELEGENEAPLKLGTEVKLNADHMEGMQGATATIVSAEKTTVYMVDFTSTSGEQVTNHKWLVESELTKAE